MTQQVSLKAEQGLPSLQVGVTPQKTGLWRSMLVTNCTCLEGNTFFPSAVMTHAEGVLMFGRKAAWGQEDTVRSEGLWEDWVLLYFPWNC